jgi:hypothetical protein
VDNLTDRLTVDVGLRTLADLDIDIAVIAAAADNVVEVG